jgi:hypothetical protein
MKTIKGNLVLEKDTEFEESITVDGHIVGKDGNAYDLKVKGDILAWDISANNISAKDILANNISAKDILAWDISASNISAKDILAWDISASNILARNISYYAFCIAYNNIICKSICGQRDNSFHRCLDGKLKIVGDEKHKYCSQCGRELER